jgi:hypothetical protein
MARSQNGWPVVDRDSIVDRAVLGVEFPNGWLKGDVDTVFTYLIGRLHREVERLDNGGCWGWFVKNIEGSNTISNHASGTAIDYNAPAHPMGVRGTYSSADQSRIRGILADLDGVVRWGGDYSGRPDDMHFEINKDAAAVRKVAARIKGEFPVDQADFNRLMDGWAKSTNGKAALVGAAQVAVDKRVGDVVPRLGPDGETPVPETDGNPTMGVNSALFYLARDVADVKRTLAGAEPPPAS